MRRADLLTLSSLLYTLSLHLGGRAFGPPLCRGCAPATPPYKTISHRPCAFFATCLANSVSSPTCPLMPPPTAVPRSSPAVPPQFPRSSPAVFPQFPCSSPQRRALASHLVHSSPATCLDNSIPPKRSGRGRPCACPVPPTCRNTISPTVAAHSTPDSFAPNLGCTRH